MVDVSKNGPDTFRGRGDLHSNVYGMRNWKIADSGKLTGMVYTNAFWKPGTNIAKCLRAVVTGYGMNPYGWAGQYVSGTQIAPLDIDALEEPEHDLYACSHGFYAYYDGSRDYHQTGDVTGIIKGWGVGVLGARGFRVTRAAIVAIVFDDAVTEEQRAMVQGNYPAVMVFPDLIAMLTMFPTSADDLEFVPDPDDNFWTRSADE